MSDIKLNIGAGSTVIPGFTAIDRKLGTEAFPLNYPDNSVSEIRASHILEHLSFREVLHAMQEWTRVLKPGGRLRVSVPDFDKIIAEKNSDPTWPYILFGGQQDGDDFHKSVYDEHRLSAYLKNAGLVRIQRWESPNTDTAAHPMSLNLEGFKPDEGLSTEEVKIRAVCSIPRIGWNDSWQTITDALKPFGIPYETFNGVFWGQCMQRAFEQALRDGIDWVMTLDYDSLITVRHVNDMIRHMGENPHADAIAAFQMRRGQEYPLMTCGKNKEAPLDDGLILATTAHFGLTLLRVEAFKNLPKPWFCAKPDDNGEWGDNRLDDDIWFWHQWRLAGRNIYVAPDVRIGHLELMVSDYDENFQPRHMHVSEWRRRYRGEC